MNVDEVKSVIITNNECGYKCQITLNGAIQIITEERTTDGFSKKTQAISDRSAADPRENLDLSNPNA